MRVPIILKTAMIGLMLVIGHGGLTAKGTTNESGANVLPNLPFTEEFKGWSQRAPQGEESNVVFKVQQTAKGVALCVENKEGKNAAGNMFITHVNNQSRIPLRTGAIYSLSASYTLSEQMADAQVQVRITPIDAEGKAVLGHYFWISGGPAKNWKPLTGEWVPPTNAVSASLTIFFNGKGVFQFAGLELMERMAEKNITFNGKTFLFTPRNKEKDLPLGNVSRRDKKTGLLIYQRDPRMVYPDSVPQPHEVIKEVAGFGTRGERKGLFFTVYALRNVDLLGVKLENPLVNEKGETIPAEAVTIKEIKFWPQRTSWKSLSYYIIPELLEESPARTLPAEMSRGFWLDIKTPSGIGPGDYKSELTVNTGNGKTIKLPLRIKIMSFELMPPEGIDWIMYADIKSKYSDGQMRRYLLDLKEYGINGLMGFPRDKRSVDLIKETGFTGPMVSTLYFESATAKKMEIKPEDVLSAWESNKDFRKACLEEIRTQMKEIRDLGLTNALYTQLIDEPCGNPEKMKIALFRGEIFKEAGVQTYCTAYAYDGLKQLAPFLDADANSFLCKTEEGNRRYRELAAQHSMQLWYLGAGCYGGQEGGLMPDRWYGGLLFYKSGATAHISWTYQRSNDDPFTDFDGEKKNPAEPKDQCITYPARTISDQQVTLSTLQWEGIREGIMDYKYLYTLKRYTEQARAKGLAELADESDKVIKTILDSVPWTEGFQTGNSYLASGNFSNDTADALRWMAARQTEKIVTALK